MTAGKDVLPDLVHAMPAQPIGVVNVVGVDDFAIKRGATYGTIIVDMRTGKAIDLLEGRDADRFASWLAAHHSIEVICRDRAGGYAEAANSAAMSQKLSGGAFGRCVDLEGERVDEPAQRNHTCSVRDI